MAASNRDLDYNDLFSYSSMAFTFLKDCLQELEARGLTDQGLYRVGGVLSKVKKLLNEGLLADKPMDLSDPKQWESKTIASAVKQYFRDLNKPLMTHTLYEAFVASVKHEDEADRLSDLSAVMKKLPAANREMLKVLVRHLSRVKAKSEKNLMTAGNLAVCFGPTLLRPREETVASIMDIKFCNEVVEILIDNCDTFFPERDATSASPKTPKTPTGLTPSSSAESSSPEANNGERVRKYAHNKGKAPKSPHSEDAPDFATSGKHSRALINRDKRGSSTPKRTHSFSAFSQLSTNSLPDIKDIKPHIIGGHHHHHHHHHGGARENSGSKTSPRKLEHQRQDSPDPRGLRLLRPSKKADDLMASLEMMNSLAADLPQGGNGNGLKRSFTVQHRKGSGPSIMSSPNYSSSSSGGPHKPPLPKLSLPSPVYSPVISDTSSTDSSVGHNSSSNGSSSPHFKQILSSRINASSPNISYSGSSHYGSHGQMRPKELFVRQITLPMEPPIVPSPSLAKPSKDIKNSSSSSPKEPETYKSSVVVPPPIPTRRFRRIYNTSDSEPDFYLRKATHSGDSGILTSPSPPTAPPTPPTATSIPTNKTASKSPMASQQEAVDKQRDASTSEDTVSISSSVSEDTNSGGSR